MSLSVSEEIFNLIKNNGGYVANLHSLKKLYKHEYKKDLIYGGKLKSLMREYPTVAFGEDCSIYIQEDVHKSKEVPFQQSSCSRMEVTTPEDIKMFAKNVKEMLTEFTDGVPFNEFVDLYFEMFDKRPIFSKSNTLTTALQDIEGVMVLKGVVRLDVNPCLEDQLRQIKEIVQINGRIHVSSIRKEYLLIYGYKLSDERIENLLAKCDDLSLDNGFVTVIK